MVHKRLSHSFLWQVLGLPTCGLLAQLTDWQFSFLLWELQIVLHIFILYLCLLVILIDITKLYSTEATPIYYPLYLCINVAAYQPIIVYITRHIIWLYDLDIYINIRLFIFANIRDKTLYLIEYFVFCRHFVCNKSVQLSEILYMFICLCNLYSKIKAYD